MTRVLQFDGPKAAKRFELCRVALLSAGDGKGERTRAIIRQEARLLDAFDTISLSAPTPTDSDLRVLKSDAPAMLIISQEDFDLLNTYADKTLWLPRAARDAVDLQDWLSSAEKQE